MREGCGQIIWTFGQIRKWQLLGANAALRERGLAHGQQLCANFKKELLPQGSPALCQDTWLASRARLDFSPTCLPGQLSLCSVQRIPLYRAALYSVLLLSSSGGLCKLFEPPDMGTINLNCIAKELAQNKINLLEKVSMKDALPTLT